MLPQKQMLCTGDFFCVLIAVLTAKDTFFTGDGRMVNHCVTMPLYQTTHSRNNGTPTVIPVSSLHTRAHTHTRPHTTAIGTEVLHCQGWAFLTGSFSSVNPCAIRLYCLQREKPFVHPKGKALVGVEKAHLRIETICHDHQPQKSFPNLAHTGDGDSFSRAAIPVFGLMTSKAWALRVRRPICYTGPRPETL